MYVRVPISSCSSLPNPFHVCLLRESRFNLVLTTEHLKISYTQLNLESFKINLKSLSGLILRMILRNTIWRQNCGRPEKFKEARQLVADLNKKHPQDKRYEDTLTKIMRTSDHKERPFYTTVTFLGEDW